MTTSNEPGISPENYSMNGHTTFLWDGALAVALSGSAIPNCRSSGLDSC